MTKQAVGKRIRAILTVIGEILWRSFGLGLFYVPRGLAVGGGFTMFTGDLMNTVVGASAGWFIALLDAYAEIGKEIALTAKVTSKSINKGFRNAVEQAEEAEALKEQQDKKK